MVTGGAGFIGSHIVRDLVKEGERVVIYDLYPEGSFLRHLLSESEMAGITIVKADVTDLAHLIHTAEENKVEKVIHMAALLPDASSVNPPLALKIISGGTLNVFEMARILRMKKVVWASTISVFGPPEKYAEEYVPNDALYGPFGVYGACKALNESMTVHYADQFGVDITAIRYSAVFGSGRRTLSNWTVFCRELIENPAVGKSGRVPYGDDSPDWLYVDDAARATLLAAKVPRTKTRVFNISGELRSVKEVAKYVRGLIPNADITLLPGCLGVHWKYETTPIRKELGFEPEWTVEQGVREMVNFKRQEQGLSLV
jgi:UDP-glucose 4-epimerase